MSREKKLISNMIVLAIGKFLPSLFSVITIPILTATLSKTEFGTYDLITTLVMLVLPVATLQIQTAAFRFLINIRNNEIECKTIISSIVIFTLPISFVITFLFLLIYPLEISNFSILLVALYFIANIIEITFAQITRGLGNNKIYSISAILLSSVNTLLIFILVYLYDWGFQGVIASIAFANVIASVFLFFSMKLYRYIRVESASLSMIKELLKYSWPMIPNNLSGWVLKLSDRVIITSILGAEFNAVYSVANKIPNMLSVGQSVFVMAWQENASLSVDDDDADIYYSKMFDRTFSFIAGCTALLIAFAPFLFRLLVHGDYDDALLQMPFLYIGMFFYCMSSFQGGIYIAHKQTKQVGLSTIIAACINLIVDLILIKEIGLFAGSISTLVAYAFLYYYRLFDVKKIQTINYDYSKQLAVILLLCIMSILSYFQSAPLIIINILISFAACILLNIDLIKHYIIHTI